MKKSLTTSFFIVILQTMFAQFNPAGTSLTTDIFRSGKVAFGYTTMPAFGNNSFLFAGNTTFANTVTFGPTFSYNQSLFGIGTSKSILMSTILNNACLSIGGPSCEGVFAAPNINFGYSNFAKIGDVVLKGESAGSFIIGNEQNGSIKFETGKMNVNTKIQMMIDNKGNIGIGTGSALLNPLEKLAVNGLIHTKEVKVDLVGWPDYVFEKEYKLPTLQEVEKQIAINGHLANIPSAKDVEENGLLLGDMNKKLLLKVEELTLYIIEQNKINEKQNKKIDQLEALVNKLINK